ncbi:MAG: DUF2059 domain-containing protein [Pseudomonadota bacterium]
MALLLALATLGAADRGAAQETIGLPAELYDPEGAIEGADETQGMAEGAASAPERKLEKAREVLALALPKSRLGEMLTAIRPELEEHLRKEASRRGKTLTPEIADALVTMQAEELNALYEAMAPRLPPLYADTFTEAELDKLLDLYGSPEGRSILAKLDALSLALAETMRPYIAIYRNRLKERVLKRLESVE